MEEFNLTHSSLSFKNLFFVKKKNFMFLKKNEGFFLSGLESLFCSAIFSLDPQNGRMLYTSTLPWLPIFSLCKLEHMYIILKKSPCPINFYTAV